MSLLSPHIANLLNTAYSYISPQPSTEPSPISRQPSAVPSPLAERLHAACHSPTSSIAHLDPPAMRRELDNAKHDLARANSDARRFEERCKMLEKTLKETRELLRSREAELEKLRRERDRERAMAERRRSDVGPQYQPQQSLASISSAIPYSRSLDTRMSSSELSRQMHTNRAAQDAQRTMSPSRYSISSASASSLSVSSESLNGNANIVTVTEEDRARLRSAETYMTRTDSWSGAQVLQAIHDLNQEILQFAAAATETCTFSPPASTPRLAQVMQDTSTRIGPNITRILADRDHSQDPLLVQLALQGCVSLCVARALNSFCIGFPTKSDAVLSQIYTHIHTTEPQPTSAKWRALTHQHIHAIYPTLTDYSVSELSDTILRWCTDIFAVANCRSFASAPTATATPGPGARSPAASPAIPTASEPPAAQLRARYLDQIRRISRAVLRLASVTREDIISTSFEVVIADPSGTFVEGEMVDAFGDYSESDGAILVTMELGLKCVTRVSPLPSEVLGLQTNGSNGSAGSNGNGAGAGRTQAVNGKENAGVEEGILETRILLQPKVVLESVLEVLDN
ncbi:hypothetical protein D9619_004134 [Psilocybe cf. subviscida]|uniref:Uncharacterized protein n=1 Tax=Psilocybe cf. subviscida TaxID=2480587 RepID=A0A8H5F8G5_9AGAR|nr:hypothetical protein D9619_004134 [Psilocybe cf. subviscida]